ncbi:amino acid adenylation domain-containing protein [Amycolatopsis rubida]|uniref:Amino acid adenylation domain-containing protein n=1 Tax=Amycolatopsis rubida TaxID=112413 RepID=A0ABX0BXC2_9PSEU|nr:amino acid adenylation domain-containing protein [Amycolatopsis rubida]MYW93794.1 amino acid adenylation domain-containing protein [Amycolatopsis rubida]NEC58784.1 amino acid adenylation domain-containing protein [Amycolatopsis rubida]
MGTEREHHLESVREWNDTATDYPRKPAHELLAEQALARGGTVALSPESGEDITYSELHRRVGAVAAALAGAGVRRGDSVAVMLRRSVSGYLAVLGVLRAGGRFVPVDPESPAERAEAILSDAGCEVVIAPSGSTRRLTAGTTVVDIDEIDADAPAPPMPRVSGEDPAYVLYTSGTTGRPKGVVVPHRAIARLVLNSDLVGFGPDDTVCGTVNLTFDLSVFELFGALLNGARLVVPDRETVLSAEALGSLLVREQVSVMWLGAALFEQMAAQRPSMFRTLRCLVAGGDALSPAAVRAVLEHGRPGQLIDGYGPTEGSVLCTAYVIDELPQEAESVPIGRPISNSTAYVVRKDGSLADVGEEGELWVGGDGLALEYLHLDELTAERFVPDRFSGGSGRLYRTGDMARWRADGVIEFRGRRDRQVKLSGYRVELREIELALASHPRVKAAAVDVLAQEGHEGYLVGWITTDADEERSLPMVLRRYLRDRVPVFMVPREIRVIDAMPVNTHGKIDWEALATIDARTVPMSGEGPREGIESTVAEVWRQVLGVPVIERTDDFFALGGQSLQAAQVAAAAGGRTGLSARHTGVLIRALLGNATLAQFSERLRAALSGIRVSPPQHAIDFRREATLPEGLRFDAPQPSDPLAPARVLLTGSTGFLGVFLLDRLVAAGVSEVHCLVRARDAAHVRYRLATRMRRYGLDYDKVRDHVVPVVGDISLPRLGLDHTAFEHLADVVDAVLHNGSLINFAYPYAALSATNVGGVRTLLELATRRRLKPFHHVSTIISLVGFGTADIRYLTEDRPLDFPERISLGYAESKWVAEELVHNAGRRGMPVSVYRPYEITGTRDRGIWNTDTLMCAWFRTIAETGLAPDVELPLDFVPVDYTADAIVGILRTQQPDGRSYNIANPHDARLGLLVDRLRALGYPVRTVPYDAWTAHVTALTAADPHHPMTPFMPMFNDKAADAPITVKEMYFAGTFPEFSRTNTERATAGAGLDLPPVDADLIDKYLGYFTDSGFLTPPSPSATSPAADIAEPAGDQTARLVRRLQPDTADLIRAAPLYALIRDDALAGEHLNRLIAAELSSHPVEVATFTRLSRRFHGTPAGTLFAEVAKIVAAARPLLRAAAESLAIDAPDPIPPGTADFVAFLTWLSDEADAGAAASALRNDLIVWCAFCAELSTALHRTGIAPEAVVEYLGHYREAPPDILRTCADIIEHAIDQGEDISSITDASRRVESALHSCWNTVALG